VSAYYNEFDPFAAAWLRALIAKGFIPAGEVDERSILDVRADDLRGFRQCHFFAGIGGWPYALRLAGWGDDRAAWTGSCPCQPISVAGKQKGADDERHLWPAFQRLIAERRPPVVFGEQVAGALGCEWLAGVRADLESLGYACGAADLPACSVGAPHIRHRLYWCAVDDADRSGLVEQRRAEPIPPEFAGIERAGCGCDMADASRQRHGECERDAGTVDCSAGEHEGEESSSWRSAQAHFNSCAGDGGFWSDYEWRTGADGKERRVKPGLRLLVDGLPGRVGRLRGYGNAIVPQVAAEFVGAVMECIP
jgi:DNA (cytosine-5)-methyltransferase 1